MKKLSIIFLFIFLACWLEGVLLLDPDFGWHIQIGNFVHLHGIPLTDPFSYSMPTYHFVDHEWLTDAIVSWAYPIIGVWLVSAIFGLFATSAIIFSYLVIDKKIRGYAYIPLILISVSLVSLAGIRMQVITWFFWSLLLWVLLRQQKLRVILPLIFLFWANLHGGFLTGLILLGIIFVIEMFVARKFLFRNIAILAASILVTFINPYGISLWTEIWKSIADTSLHTTVKEWWPTFYRLDFALWLFFALSLIVCSKYRHTFSLTEKVLYSIFLLVGLSSMRNIPLWLFIALPITVKAIALFAKEAKKHAITRSKFAIATKVLIVFVAVLSIFELMETYKEAYGLSEKNFYPGKAITYLHTHPLRNHIFSYYGWGGYLIWKMPSEKVFIDGRMPSWRFEKPIKNESQFAFGEYNDFLNKKISFAIFAKKYGINTIIWPAQSGYEKDFQKAGFQKIYEDPIAEVYKRE